MLVIKLVMLGTRTMNAIKCAKFLFKKQNFSMYQIKTKCKKRFNYTQQNVQMKKRELLKK